MANKRDCENCIHKVPRKTKGGTWTADCECWECDFLSRKEVLEAWKEKQKPKSKESDEVMKEAEKEAHYLDEREDTIAGRWQL